MNTGPSPMFQSCRRKNNRYNSVEAAKLAIQVETGGIYQYGACVEYNLPVRLGRYASKEDIAKDGTPVTTATCAIDGRAKVRHTESARDEKATQSCESAKTILTGIGI